METNKFFDICSCMCPSASYFQVNCIAKNCNGFHLACKCDVKVSKCEIPFLLDQRGARKMVISDNDKDLSKMWARTAAKDEAMEVAVKIEKGHKCSLISPTTVLTMQATTTGANWTRIIFKRPCQTTISKET